MSALPSDKTRPPRHKYAVRDLLNVPPTNPASKVDDKKADSDEQPEINNFSDIDYTTPSPSPQPRYGLAMFAIRVFEDLLKGNHVRDGVRTSDLKSSAPILEVLVTGNQKVPEIPLLIGGFQDVCSNMKKYVCLDFDLLDGDYAAVKGVFVDGGAGNRSSVRLDRLMSLLIGADVRKVELCNVTVKAETMECILSCIKDDKHYDDNHQLKAKVDEFVVNRRDGIELEEIKTEYAQQFKEYGWKITISDALSEIHISLDKGFENSWEWYEEDFENDDDAKQPPESGNNAEIEPSAPPAPEIEHKVDDALYPPAPYAPTVPSLPPPPPSRESMHRRRKASHARREQAVKEMEKQMFVSVWEYESTKGKWKPLPVDVQGEIDAMDCACEIDAMDCASGESDFKEFKELGCYVMKCSRDFALWCRHGTMYQVRRRLVQQTASKYPQWWTSSANDKFKLVEMDLSDTENWYLQRLCSDFDIDMYYELDWRITRIESVENPMLYAKHKDAEQALMDCGQEPNVRGLWYGASRKDIESITQQGFCKKSLKPRWRNGPEGTYFSTGARDSGRFAIDQTKLSSSSFRIRKDKGVFQMLFCRVICGKSTTNFILEPWKRKRGRAPWPKKPNGQIYDSLQNNSGSMFVIHDDVRAYPLFVVHFKVGRSWLSTLRSASRVQ